MSRACPFCATEIDEAARLCPSCGGTVLKACPFCAEDVIAQARVCKWCQSDLTTPTGDAPPRPAPGTPISERGIAATLTLSLLTCGLYGFYVLYEQMREIQAHAGGRARGLEPTRDLVLSIVSHFATLGICPIWIYYVMYAYPRAYQEACVAEEIPCRDVLTSCVLLSVMSASLLCVSIAIPLWVIAVAILQHELNQHVRLHRELGAFKA